MNKIKFIFDDKNNYLLSRMIYLYNYNYNKSIHLVVALMMIDFFLRDKK